MIDASVFIKDMHLYVVLQTNLRMFTENKPVSYEQPNFGFSGFFATKKALKFYLTSLKTLKQTILDTHPQIEQFSFTRQIDLANIAISILRKPGFVYMDEFSILVAVPSRERRLRLDNGWTLSIICGDDCDNETVIQVLPEELRAKILTLQC